MTELMKILSGIATGIIATLMTHYIITRFFTQPPVITLPGEGGMSLQIKGKEAKQWWMHIREKKAIDVYNEGVSALISGDNGQAILKFREAIFLKPKSAETHNSFAVALKEQGKYEEAEKECHEVLHLQSHYAEAHNTLGIVLGWQKKYKQAEKELSEALRLKKDFPEAHNNLGIIIGWQGAYKEAEEEFREAIRLKPDFAEAICNLGAAINRQRQNVEESAKYYKEAIRIKPNFALAHVNLGACYLNVQNYDEAEKEFREAIRLKPQYALGHKGLGDLYLHQGKLKEAQQCYEEAIRCDPNPQKPTPHISLSYIFWVQGNHEEADRLIKKAVSLKSPDPHFYFRLAELKAYMGKSEEAIKYLQTAIDMGFFDWRLIDRTKDFDCMRNDNRFIDLISELKAKDTAKEENNKNEEVVF